MVVSVIPISCFSGDRFVQAMDTISLHSFSMCRLTYYEKWRVAKGTGI